MFGKALKNAAAKDKLTVKKEKLETLQAQLSTLKRARDDARREGRASVSDMEKNFPSVKGRADAVKKIAKDYQITIEQCNKKIAGLERSVASLTKEIAAMEIRARHPRVEVPGRLSKFKESTTNSENGGNEMKIYTDEDITRAKVKIYESCRHGLITESQKDTLLEHLDDAIDQYNESVDEFNAQQQKADLDYNAMKLFIYESAREGKLTDEQRDYMLENL